ncbi:unnamed protein product [Cyclocybe aegerita]|uniref:Uncharacterized protein n=1 Tax=Cyclocybe aegerita TaxID=1973307 RepID=A0A8S0W272_CYCAE|nr:unnamed protein product [Cyclocybe aegerita]
MASSSSLPQSSPHSLTLRTLRTLTHLTPLLPLLSLSLLPRTKAYTWAFERTAQQCQNLTISVSGSDGRPPYRVLILPFGPSPLEGNVEVRRILDVPFPGEEREVSFQLRYPESSQFVAVVSDASGFGSGGTSVAAQVTASSDSSCFDPTVMVSPQFVFSIEPANQIVQCVDTRIWWDPANVQGTPNFLGVIPGGQSFAVPQGQITTVPSQGTGFTWKPSLRGGTTLILVGGDSRGNGTGGSTLNVVSSGIQNDGSCLSNSSPSSTPGSPAGGSYPTGTDGGSSSGSGGSSNVGAIVGGVIGGLALIIAGICLLWFLRRRQSEQKRVKERPVDLLNADDDVGDEAPRNGAARTNELPQYYQPEPFLVPDPTLPSSTEGTSAGDDLESRRPLSGGTTMSFYTRTGTPDPSISGVSGSGYGYGLGAAGGAGGGGGGGGSSQGEGRRKGPLRQMRPVNIIQHDDAGPSLPDTGGKEDEEPVTIELPPAYTAVGRTPQGVATPPAQTQTPAAVVEQEAVARGQQAAGA